MSGVADGEQVSFDFPLPQIVFFILIFAISTLLLVFALSAWGMTDEMSIGGAVILTGLPTVLVMGYYGMVKEISIRGFVIKFRKRSIESEESVSLEFDPEEIGGGSPTVEAAVPDFDRWADVVKRTRPTVLSFRLGESPYYDMVTEREQYIEDINKYIENMPRLSYVVFNDKDGTFRGLMDDRDFRSLYHTDPDGFINLLESEEELLDLPGVVTASVPEGTRNDRALDKMEDAGVDMLAVVDDQDRFNGVITQDMISRQLVTDLIKQMSS